MDWFDNLMIVVAITTVIIFAVMVL